MIQRQINFYCFQLVIMNGRNLGDLDGANQMQHVTVLALQPSCSHGVVLPVPIIH